MEEQLTLEEILREGMIGNPNKELHSDDLKRAAERGDTEGKILGNDRSKAIQKVESDKSKMMDQE